MESSLTSLTSHSLLANSVYFRQISRMQSLFILCCKPFSYQTVRVILLKHKSMSCQSSAQILLMSSQLIEWSSSPLACKASYCLSELISSYSSPCTLGSTVGSFLFPQHLTPSLLRTLAHDVSLLEYGKHSLRLYLLQVCPNATLLAFMIALNSASPSVCLPYW